MKKIFAIIILLCGIVGNSWAVCELSESTDRTQSDEDIYLSKEAHDTTRMALICQKGKCEDGEIIHVRVSHYKKNRLIEKAAYYRCKLGGNDRWLEATSGDIPVSDERADLIVYDDDKEMFVYGKEASDGNYYTNVHYVKPDEKCGVKCTQENIDGYVYCDKDLWICQQSGFNAADRAPFGFCIYSDPQTRERYTVESEWTNYYMWSFWGATGLQDGDSVDSNMSFCMGCKTGGFKGGDNKCYNKLDEAWCSWRKNIDGKNTEWKDDKCKCNDNGMEWSTEQHDCVKSGKGGKTGGSTGGGSGSTGQNRTCEELHPNGSAERLACCRAGKSTTWTGTETSGTCSCVDKNKQWQYTAGARTGQCVAKSGAGNKTEVCGVKCNAKNSGKHFYCDGGIYYCYEDSNTYAFLVSINNLLAPCEYTDPLTTVYKTETDFVASYKEANNVKFFGKRVLVNGEEIIPESNDFCMGCRKGLFFEPIDCSSESDMEEQHAWSGYTKYWDFVYGGCSTDGACIDDLDRAWCYWQKVKEKMNVKWSGDNGCKCLDDGKVWDPKTHNCIADTGGKTPPQPKDKKIDCVIELGASVRCKDGTGFDKTTTLSITSEKCDLYKSNIAKYLNEITQTLCANHGGVVDVLSNQEIKDAAARIDNFMKYAESNPNVWKNAEGKFNTARLASDATAGVILGTVGGIVSAHIIKKKQVEKGFDVLNCSIGGQKVADWGDEFRVGFGK